MSPRLIACTFGEGYDRQYPRMARVLEHTARRHCAGWDVHVTTLQEARLHRPGRSEGDVANVVKMRHWIDAVTQAPDQAPLLLIDGDTMILQPLDDVWTQPFDVAYTARASSRFPLNGGVVFLRATAATRRFVTHWMAEAERMLLEPVYHQPWRRRYGGLSQAALGATFAAPIAQATSLVALPCLEWNCEDTCWPDFDPQRTRIVHVKSTLRRAVFNMGPLGTHLKPLKPLVTIWRRLEAEALAPASQTA